MRLADVPRGTSRTRPLRLISFNSREFSLARPLHSNPGTTRNQRGARMRIFNAHRNGPCSMPHAHASCACGPKACPGFEDSPSGNWSRSRRPRAGARCGFVWEYVRRGNRHRPGPAWPAAALRAANRPARLRQSLRNLRFGNLTAQGRAASLRSLSKSACSASEALLPPRLRAAWASRRSAYAESLGRG